MTIGMITDVLEQGLIYGILALGLLITYRILDFPDLTVDSSFPLGAAVSAVLTLSGVAPWLTLICSLLAGALAGLITGLIHVKCKVRDLLSGIITMTGLYSVNLRIAGRANVPLFAGDTLFKSEFTRSLPDWLSPYSTLIICLVIVLIAKLVMDWFLKTKAGFQLRAALFIAGLAQQREHVLLVGFHAGLVEGIHAQQVAGQTAGLLEEVAQVAEVVGVRLRNF